MFLFKCDTKPRRPITGQQSKHKKYISSNKSQKKTQENKEKQITRSKIVKTENADKVNLFLIY